MPKKKTDSSKKDGKKVEPARNAPATTSKMLAGAGGGETNEETKPHLRIKLRAYDHKIIDNSARQIIDIATRYGAEVVGPIPLPTEIIKQSVLRSTFIHKNAWEQFEMRIYKRIIDILNPNPDILEALKDMNLPSGVDITVKI